MKKNKNITLIISILVIVMVLAIGIIRNNPSILNGKYKYNPYEDIREYDSMHDSIELESLPENIITNQKKFIDEYGSQIVELNSNIEYKNIQNVDNKDSYRLDYLFVDKSLNRILSSILLYYDYSGNLIRIKIDYRNQDYDAFVKYFGNFIKLNCVNLSEERIKQIQDGIENNDMEKEWKIGDSFTYEYSKEHNEIFINIYY